jgi:hypothetical protein
MKKILLLISLGILLATFITPVYSSDHNEKQSYDGHLGDGDTDGDDQLDWKEFKKFFPHAKKEVFKKIDANNDDLVDHDEWHEFKAAEGYEHKE